MQIFPISYKNEATALVASIVAILFLSPPAGLSAQERVDSLQGRLVRLTLRDVPPDSTLVGTLRGADSSGLTLRISNGAIELVPRTQILQVEVRDAALGKVALAGGAIGAVIGYRVYMESGSGPQLPKATRTRGVLLAAPVGALLGALFGPVLAVDAWRPVHLDSPTGPGRQLDPQLDPQIDPRRDSPLTRPRTVALESLEGKRVRLTLRGSPPDSILVGRLRRVDSLGVTLRIRAGVTTHVPRADILRVEVSDHRPGMSALAGLGLGAVAGATAWTVLASLVYEGHGIEAVVIAMPVGALLGAVIGPILNTGNEQWLPVYLDPVSGPGLRVGIRLTLP